MTIKEVEQLLEIPRATVRFYEKEGLVNPSREGNGYRDYSDEDVEKLKKIVILRKIDMSVEDINDIFDGVKSVNEVLDANIIKLQKQMNELKGAINLSKKITDEMVIIVYSNAEVEDFKKTKELEKQVQESCIQKDENSLKNDACIGEASSNTGLISINTATEEELSSLSGIGPSKAKQIIEYRNSSGPFKTIEDIKQVPGIGESIYAQIKDYITT